MTLTPLPSLRTLTTELRALHEAWSHPDAGGEYVRLYLDEDGGWSVAAITFDDQTQAYVARFGSEYVPGSRTLRECECAPERTFSLQTLRAHCGVCGGSGYVHVPTPFDATAAARRLLAAARDGGYR